MNRKLKNRCNFISGIDYIENTYDEIINSEYPVMPYGMTGTKGYGKGKSTYFKLTKDAFKILLFKCCNNDKFIKYYIKLENLFTDYLKYQMTYENIKDNYNITNIIKQKDDKIDILSEQITHQSHQITQQSEQIADLLLRTKDIYNQNTNLNDKVTNLTEQNDITHNKLDILTTHTKNMVTEVKTIKSKIVPKLKNKKLKEYFILLHDAKEYNTYYAMRIQECNIENAIKNKKKKNPSLYILFEIIDYSHPKKLYNLLKQYINDNKLKKEVDIYSNNITTSNNYKCASTNPDDHKLIKIIKKF